MFTGRGHDGESSLQNKGGGEEGEGEVIEDAGDMPPGPKHYTYEIHNIIYRVAEDNSGAFNGSDEFAMKVDISTYMCMYIYVYVYVVGICVCIYKSICMYIYLDNSGAFNGSDDFAMKVYIGMYIVCYEGAYTYVYM
jgi:hypothetical protein